MILENSKAIEWHGGWEACYRHPRAGVRRDIGMLAREVAANDAIGAGSGLWAALCAATSRLPKNVKAPCGADSAGTAAALAKAAGVRKGDSRLAGIDPGTGLDGLGAALEMAGFEKLSDDGHTGSDELLLAGDVLVGSGGAAVVLDAGDRSSSEGRRPAAAEPAGRPRLRVSAPGGLNYRLEPGGAIMGTYPGGSVIEAAGESETVGGIEWVRASNGYWSDASWLEDA